MSWEEEVRAARLELEAAKTEVARLIDVRDAAIRKARASGVRVKDLQEAAGIGRAQITKIISGVVVNNTPNTAYRGRRAMGITKGVPVQHGDMEAVRKEIEDTIEASGVGRAADYDIDAIAQDCYEWKANYRPDGVQVGNGRFECVVDVDAFWAAVRRYRLAS